MVIIYNSLWYINETILLSIHVKTGIFYAGIVNSQNLNIFMKTKSSRTNIFLSCLLKYLLCPQITMNRATHFCSIVQSLIENFLMEWAKRQMAANVITRNPNLNQISSWVKFGLNVCHVKMTWTKTVNFKKITNTF